MTTRKCDQRGREFIGLAAVCLVGIGLSSVARGQVGTVIAHQKISDTEGGFAGTLQNDQLGAAVASLGDLDGDGVVDLAVGAIRDDDGGNNVGAVWILFLNADGTVRSEAKITPAQAGFTGSNEQFGVSLAGLGDLDGDGVPDLAAGTRADDDGGHDRGAVWILFLDIDGTVKSKQKISSTEGGFLGFLSNDDLLGSSVSSLGDLDGDGVGDLAVGAQSDDDGGANRGAVWILFLDTDGTVKSHQKISAVQGGFGGSLANGDTFGSAAASIGDLDGDGIGDLAVGAPEADDGGARRGAVYILFLETDGTVGAHQKISNTDGGFTGTLNDVDVFGRVAALGDLDGDGVVDLAVGASGDDDAGGESGAVWVLLLNSNGTVKSHQKISGLEGGFTGQLDNGDQFGLDLSSVGDLDGDGVTDLAVGSPEDDDGGTDHGAVWMLFLDAVGSASEQIDDMLDFIEMAVAEGSLEGNGPGGSGKGRLNALINQIEAAGDLVEAGMIDEACDQLQDALNRTDGESPPPDFVTGDAAPELAQLIEILRTSLGCD